MRMCNLVFHAYSVFINFFVCSFNFCLPAKAAFVCSFVAWGERLRREEMGGRGEREGGERRKGGRRGREEGKEGRKGRERRKRRKGMEGRKRRKEKRGGEEGRKEKRGGEEGEEEEGGERQEEGRGSLRKKV